MMDVIVLIIMIVAWVAVAATVIGKRNDRGQARAAARWQGIAVMLCLAGGILDAFGHLHQRASSSLVVIDGISILLAIAGLGVFVFSFAIKKRSQS
jgi:hypothetical protein